MEIQFIYYYLFSNICLKKAFFKYLSVILSYLHIEVLDNSE